MKKLNYTKYYYGNILGNGQENEMWKVYHSWRMYVYGLVMAGN